MDTSLKVGTYNFANTIVLIQHPLYDAPLVIDGFMSDSQISVAKDNPTWSLQASGDAAAITFVKDPSKAGTIKFSLNQTTDSLAKLNAIVQLSEISEDYEDFVFEITIADKNSGSIHYSQMSVASDPESIDYGKEENGREFTIVCAQLNSTLNGTARVPKQTLEFVQALGFTIDPTRVAAY